MPVVEERGQRDGLILAIGAAVVAALAVVGVLMFGMARPVRTRVVTGAAAPTPGTGTGSWGSGTAVGVSISSKGASSFTHSFVPAEVANPARVTAVTLSVSGTHSRPEDLEIVLIAPDGTRAMVRKQGTPGELTAKYAATPPLAPLAGKPVNGPWQVVVGDRVAGSGGKLEEVKLDLDYSW